MHSAAASGVAGLAAGALAAIAADVGAIAIAGVLVLVMVGLLFRAHHWMRFAGRSRVGARSEDEVLIVSLDRLVVALRTAAGTSQRPAFLGADPMART